MQKDSTFNSAKFEKLKDEVKIELLDCNKELFKKEDRIQIVAELKNTPQLYVKIYEFDRKTDFSGCSSDYYQKNLVPFKTDINLEGLMTENEKVHEFDELPQKKFRHVFEFPELDDRVGLFIIEFISNGYSSRAVIKKGSLSLVVRSTVAGHIAYVLDENKEICKGEDTGMWFQNKFYKADPAKNGKIIIPYDKEETSDKAILVNNGFAQLAEFHRLTEKYYLDCGYFIQNESLLMGNEAKLLLRPVLKVNDRQCTLKALKNIRITITTQSYTEGIPTTKVFENLHIDDSDEIMLNFQVPPNLEKVDIEFEAQIRNISQQKFDNLHHKHTITMKTNAMGTVYYEDYLRKHNGEYYYYILGKNGEPIEDTTVTVCLYHALQPFESFSVTSMTDSEGKINLGHLKKITKITIYPSTINVLEDEVIEIPFPGEDLNQNTFSLVKTDSIGNIIENYIEHATLEKEEGYLTNLVVIRDLEFGRYKIEFKETGTPISLFVHQGVYWESDSFILKDHQIVEKLDQTNFIRISKPTIEKVDDDEEVKKEDEEHCRSKLKFKIKGYKANPRVHIFGVNFIPSAPLKDFEKNEELTTINSCSDIFKFANWKNVYLSNRQLGDEYRYVFERKLFERYFGNNLDKPQLVLKRTMVKPTQFIQENLFAGKEYSSQAAENYARVDTSNTNVAPVFNQPFGGTTCNNYDLTANNFNFGEVSNSSDLMNKSFLNFLETGAFVGDNLYPDEEGNIEVEFEVEKYANIFILALDDQTCTQMIFDVAEAKEEIAKRDLALTHPLDNKKYYNEMRNAEKFNNDEKFIIDDITSTDYIIIDSLDKVNRVQEELNKLTYQGVNKEGLQFLLKWSELSEEEKHKKYNRYMSHETNVFIYFKDRPYFDKVVYPFLKNKMEKTFVDYYLLGEHEEIAEYHKVEHFNQLNAFEK